MATYRTVQVVCNDCKSWFISLAEDDKLDDDLDCGSCGGFNLRAVPPEKIEEPGALIRLADETLENANYHSLGGLPGKLYQRLLSARSEREIAFIIYDVFNSLT